MQNKPNFRKAKMNISSALTKDYENETAFSLRENKPNQTQFQKRHLCCSAGQDPCLRRDKRGATKSLLNWRRLVKMVRVMVCFFERKKDAA